MKTIALLVLTSACIFYEPAHAQLVTITPAQGATGATGMSGSNGSNGSNGTNGNTILSGVGAPISSTGNNGDYYVDTAAKVIYGPKASGTWPSGISLIGPAGVAGINAIGTPNSRTLSAATAYQASDPTKPAIVNINLTSTANLSLTGGTTNTATVYIGSTSGVSTGTGTAMCNYSNASTGTLTIGLNTNAVQASTCSFGLPIGWYFGIVVNAGTVTATNGRDQALG